jgi:hypothetical protein
MPHTIENSRVPAADQRVLPQRFQEFAQERELNADFDDRQGRTAGRWERRSYYIFRQGRLDIQTFDCPSRVW